MIKASIQNNFVILTQCVHDNIKTLTLIYPSNHIYMTLNNSAVQVRVECFTVLSEHDHC